eukprot:11434364-Karenia_brevis.AAC.1
MLTCAGEPEPVSALIKGIPWILDAEEAANRNKFPANHAHIINKVVGKLFSLEAAITLWNVRMACPFAQPPGRPPRRAGDAKVDIHILSRPNLLQ